MTSKQTALLVSVLAYAVSGFFAAEYLAGVMYYLANKTAPSGVSIGTWGDYWHWYSTDLIQRKRLQFAAVTALIGVFGVPLLILNAAFRQRRSLHGDARFALPAEIRKAGLYGDEGIIIGKSGSQYLMFAGQQFVLLAAPTRQGKSAGLVVPNLLHYPDSVVVLDIKMENFNITSLFRQRHGQKVLLFNPFAEDGRTHRWNPLDRIRRHPHFRVGDALTIGQTLYPHDDSKEGFWNDLARNLYLGLTLYLLETPALPCTFGELLRQSSGKGRPLKDHLQRIMVARNKGDDALSDECMDALNRFCSASDNTLNSILSTFTAPLTIFVNPIVDAATSYSDIDVTRVRKERMSIYIGIPPNRMMDAALLVNLFFSQLINENMKELPANNPELKYQCLLVLDECTAMGKVLVLVKAVGQIAGYNLRLMPIIQSVSQLESVYGEKDARTFISNHAVQILFPPREQKDANEYSEMLGFYTEKAVSRGISTPRAWGTSNNGSASENISDQRRALMLPQELKELGLEHEIINKENSKPILCDKAYYFNDHVFMDRLKKLSKTLAAVGRRLPTREELELAALTRHELRIELPLLDVDLHKARVESRTRRVLPGEPIDVTTLAIDIDSLPPIENQANPSDADLAMLVESFFSQVEESGSADDDLPRRPVTDPVGTAGNSLTAAKSRSARGTKVSPRRGVIDMSMLER